MITFHLKPKEYVEGTEYDRLTEYDSVSVDDNGLEFYETDTSILWRVCAGAWLAINVGGGGGSTTFIGLTDTPASFTGVGGQLVAVNGAANALEFVDLPSHNIVGTSHTVTGSQWDVVGLTATNTLGLITPSSAPGSTAKLLKTTGAGEITLQGIQIGTGGFNIVGGVFYIDSGSGVAGQFIKRITPGGGASTITFANINITDLSGTGSQYDVVGFTAANTVGILTPSADPTNAAILRTDVNGYLGVERFGVGGAPSAPYGINVDITYTGIAAIIPAGVNVDFELIPSAAHSYPNASALLFVSTWNKAATIGALYGIYGSLINNTTGTITLGAGARFGLDNISTGFITNAYGVYVATPSDASGGIGTGYGLYIGNWPNYSIYTNGGLVSLGDSLQFRQASTISTTVGALTLQPLAGQSLAVTLSTTGDFIVNTSQLVVDTSAGRVGIGTAAPSGLLHAVGSIAGAYIDDLGIRLAFTRDNANYIKVGGGSSGYLVMEGYAGSFIAQFKTGVQVGAPTGGDKGAGTINAAGDIYKNNSTYTNPDYALEMWRDGQVSVFKDNPGAVDYARLTLLEIKQHIIDNLRLPGFGDEPTGIFERGDLLLEKLEEIFTYLIDHEERLQKAEASLVI